MSSDSPTERELLQQILWRLERIEERLNIDPWKSSIGYGNDGPPLPADTGRPIEPAVPPGGSKPLPGTEPPSPAFQDLPPRRHGPEHPTVRTPGSEESLKPED
jgi:hypothetical protein